MRAVFVDTLGSPRVVTTELVMVEYLNFFADVLTNDRHFEQEGFQVLFRAS